MIIVMLLCTQTKAQKLKTDKISFEYNKYPEVFIPEVYKSFIIEPRGNIFKKKYIISKAREMPINGLEKANKTEDADLIIELYTSGDLKILSEQTVSDGTSVRKQIKFQFPLKAYLYNNKEKKSFLRSDEIIHKEDTVVYLSSTYTNEANMKFLTDDDDHKRGVYNKILKEIAIYLEKFQSIQNKEYWYLFSAKGKKLNYDEIKNALDIVDDVFSSPINKSLDSKNIEKIRTSISVFEKELSQADTLDDKARINKEIASGLNYNLAFCYTWANEFDKAWYHLAKVTMIEESYKNELSKFMDQYQNRFLHNNQNINLFNELQGKWQLIDIVGGPYDLNKDGSNSSKLLNDELPDCYKSIFIVFSANQMGKFNSPVSNCQLSELDIYWKVKRNPSFSDILLGWSEEVNERYIDEYRMITHISNKKLILHGYARLDPSSDTTNEIDLVFTKE
ncbi:hypothetical protein [Fulvivirga sediminis]|uniref:Uncharacterized protein n=1 Tax=Fulvivirga sediminis TaxID=2803949 RepID=A0A937F4F4_9BACT|nr:hypothetical protein [Fulvivirga sediminis]MBL3654494.1 hypothetical protein [Fulvivirga sediminis]